MSITDADTVYGPGAGHLNELDVPGADGKPNPYPYGECTAYIWQYYHDLQGVDIPPNLGNATDWVSSAHREQWAVDDQPVKGKAVSWSAAKYPVFGHVAVVDQVNGDGSFDVLEWNFTYYASERPELAGKIDRRTVRDRDGIQGFITPTGIKVANDGPQGSILDALSAPLTSIGDAIHQAALQFEAQAMTAQLRLLSMGQVGVGTLVAGGGLALGGLTVYGGGRPQAGARRLGRQIRRTRRQIAPARPSPIGRRSVRQTEEQWLSPAEVRALREQARQEMRRNRELFEASRRTIGPSSPAEIARDRASVLRRARERRSGGLV